MVFNRRWFWERQSGVSAFRQTIKPLKKVLDFDPETYFMLLGFS